jgi:hypothetical protein
MGDRMTHTSIVTMMGESHQVVSIPAKKNTKRDRQDNGVESFSHSGGQDSTPVFIV